MAVHNFASERLFVEAPLAAEEPISCTREQSNYLQAVLRLREGDQVLVFNGRDGEWRARISDAGKRSCSLVAIEMVRPQSGGPDLEYLFAPLKRTRLDYMVQKAVEMGVAHLRPVLTRRTVADRVNLDRMRANVIEAAEQCGVLRIAQISEPEKLPKVLASWDPRRRLVVCDESAPAANPIVILSELQPGPLAVLIGPEGGFAAEERDLLLAQTYVRAISLGPRIMRADTAAVAALAIINAVLGDWR